MAKSTVPTNIAQAMKCATKIELGKPCSVAEMKATIRLLKQGVSGARSATKVAKSALRESKELVVNLLGRVTR